MNKPTVFLSYAREDLEKATRLCNDLTRAGIEVGFDQEKLLPGQDWKATIQEHVNSCEFFIVLLSMHIR